MKTTSTALFGVVLAVASTVAATHHASADEGADAQAAFQERCASRLAIAFTGKVAARASAIDAYLDDADFQERFARFVNAQFQPTPSTDLLEDAPYWYAKKILADDLPWSAMFLGKLRLFSVGNTNVAVVPDEDGLGYFRTEHWYARYEGNEENGIKLMTAYRIMNNVVGLKLVASTSSPTTDQSASGRQASPCNGCHFDGWFALDKVASVLPKKGERFDAYEGGPQQILGGLPVASDAELVAALVSSENFSVNACRLAFQFLYAREDNHCDGPVLDRCVDAFKTTPTMKTALASIAGEPGFCE